jgi:riboflavin biosynthesis pyrimidine reductase
MQLLLSEDHADSPATDLDDTRLRELYAFPGTPWLRAYFVSTLDGRATGPDGLTDTINTPPDNRVFGLQRALCDAVVVGAGTAHAEGYQQVREDGTTPLLAIVSNAARVPQGVETHKPGMGASVLITCASAGEAALAHARDVIGVDAVWVVGDEAVDLAAARSRLHAEGHSSLLCEGGPTLFASLLAAGLVDELALTWAPSLLAGDGLRIVHGPQLDTSWRLHLLLEETSTLLGLWRRVA